MRNSSMMHSALPYASAVRRALQLHPDIRQPEMAFSMLWVKMPEKDVHLGPAVVHFSEEDGLGESCFPSHFSTATSPLGSTNFEMQPFSRMRDAWRPSSSGTRFTSSMGLIAALSTSFKPMMATSDATFCVGRKC